MKVYLSKPRYHWLSPYTILEKVFFWREIDYDEPLIDKWSDRLMPLCKGLQKVLDFIHPEIRQVKIDYWDTWSMDNTLAPIILPMLKQLKATKHGYGFIEDEDAPKHLRSIYALPKNPWDWDDNAEARYDWVLDEMIWAFEQLCDDDAESKFWITKPETDWEDMTRPFEEGETSRELKWKVEGKLDVDGLNAHNERIQRGLTLFGKYFRTLWD